MKTTPARFVLFSTVPCLLVLSACTTPPNPMRFTQAVTDPVNANSSLGYACNLIATPIALFMDAIDTPLQAVGGSTGYSSATGQEPPPPPPSEY